MITQELKDRLIADYPKFEDMTHKSIRKNYPLQTIKDNLVLMVVTLSAVQILA